MFNIPLVSLSKIAPNERFFILDGVVHRVCSAFFLIRQICGLLHGRIGEWLLYTIWNRSSNLFKKQNNQENDCERDFNFNNATPGRTGARKHSRTRLGRGPYIKSKIVIEGWESAAVYNVDFFMYFVEHLLVTYSCQVIIHNSKITRQLLVQSFKSFAIDLLLM